MDFLGEASLAHFERVQAPCSTPAASPTRVNPRLVRGMDYYNLTVFEWVTDQLGSQGTVCGGGRYDGLIEQLGGKPAPAVGLGLGIERAAAAAAGAGRCRCRRRRPMPMPWCPTRRALPLVHAHAARRCAPPACACRCMPAARTAWAASSRSSRRPTPAARAYALVFGADELARGEVTVKPLRDGGGAQVARPLADVGRLGRHPTIAALSNTDSAMATHLDLEEQEQLDQLKHFWNTVRQPDHLGR